VLSWALGFNDLIAGTIPSEVGLLTNLTHLDLGAYSLSLVHL
jgi:hypothetical protein